MSRPADRLALADRIARLRHEFATVRNADERGPLVAELQHARAELAAHERQARTRPPIDRAGR